MPYGRSPYGTGEYGAAPGAPGVLPPGKRTISDAGGNWNSPSAWVEGQVPISVDDVVATATSGNLTINVASACRSMDLTSYTSAITQQADLSIGSSTVNASTWLIPASTWNWTSGNLIFVSTAAGQVRLTSAGTILASVPLVINGAGGSLLMNGGATLSSVTLTAGTFTLNTTCTCGSFVSTGSGTRTLAMSVNFLFVIGNSGTVFNVSGSNFSQTGAGTFRFQSATGNSTVTMAMGSQTYAAGVEFRHADQQKAVVTGAFTCAFLTWTPSQLNALNCITTFQNGQTVTVTGAVTVTGSTFRYPFISSDVAGSAATISAASVSLTSAVFMDITASGAATPWTGTRIGNALGNTSITATAPTTCFWTGTANGGWNPGVSPTAANSWSTTSGGAAANRLPLPQDAVVVDSNSPSVTVTQNMAWLCKSLTQTQSGWVLTNGSGIARVIVNATLGDFGPLVFGDLTVASSWTGFSTGFNFMGRTTQNLTTGSSTFPPAIVTLSSTTLQLAANAQLGNITAYQGTFKFNGFNSTVTGVITTGFATFGTVDMGSGTCTMTATGDLLSNTVGVGATFIGASAVIIVSDTSASAKNIILNDGVGCSPGSIGTLQVAGGSGTIKFVPSGFGGSNTCDIINLALTAPASMTFNPGLHTNITNVSVSGATSSNRIIWTSSTASHATQKFGSSVVIPFADVSHSTADAAGTIPAYTQNGTLSDTTNWAVQYANTISDNEGLTDNEFASTSRTISDNEGLTDSSAAAFVLTASVTDNEGLTDNEFSSTNRSLSDNEGLTDNTSSSSSVARAISDNEGLTDNETQETDYNRSVSDNEGLTDATSPTFSRVITDNEGLTDNDFTSLNRFITDNEGLTDNLTRTVVRALTDLLGLTDAEGASLSCVLSDSEGLTDTQTPNIQKFINDNEGLTDNSSYIRNVNAILNDNEGLTDSIASRNLARSIIDHEGLSDSLFKTVALFLTDDEALSDNVLTALFQLGCAILDLPIPQVCIIIAPDTVDITIIPC